MFTRCPVCQTLFRVRAETLRSARGQVRCGRCDSQFSALDTLTEDADALAEVSAPEFAQAPVDSEFLFVRPDTSEEEQDTAAAPQVTTADALADTAQPVTAVASVPAGAAEARPAQVPDAVATPAASAPGLSPAVIQALLLQEDRAAPGRRWAWGSAAGVALLMLAGQWMYLQYPQLDAYPVLQSTLRHLCDALGCALPLPRAPDRIEVTERSVRTHPRVADALLVEVTFVSRAELPIAYPILELLLADVSGNRVAARRFAPAEYLPEGADTARGLTPGQPLQVTLELVAPRTETVSFQFEFF